MAASLADRATSDLLVGSDWAMNVEICDILNHDPGQGKDTARVLRRRICNKSTKIQLLALTLLETIIRNCGDIVHMHIAERDIPHKMVKIVKKKPDFHVKEKILVLIDTWQEAFGGPNARHPQYFAAYQELLRAGVVFPKRPPRSAPVFNPQGKPSISHAEPLSNSNHQEAATESSASSELHVLSLTDIQNARGIMDVLEEMLSALDPNNKEGVRQEVIVDLVEQCRLFRQRLVHLVSATSDEALLHQGLQLNDDLQRLLAKYDQLASQIAHHPEKPTTLQALVDIEDSTVNNQDNHTKADSRAITSTNSNNQPSHASISEPFIDLLSGDNPDVTSTETSLALAPVGELPSSSTSEPNILALSDVFSQNNNNTNSTNPTSAFDLQSASPAAHLALVPVASRFESQQTAEPILYSNGTVASPGMPQHEQVGYSEAIQWNHAHALWNDQSGQGMNPQQQAYNNSSVDQSGAFPPPPWEVQPMTGDQLTTSQHTPMLGGQLGDIPAVESVQSSQPGSVHHPFMQGSQPESIHPIVLQNNQPVGTYPSSIQSNGLGATYPQQMPGLQLQGPDPRLKGSAQLGGTYAQPMLGAQLGGIYPLVHPGAQLGGAYPQAHPGAQLGGAYTHARPGIQFGGFTYSQQPDAQFYYQRPAYPPLGPNDISGGIYGLSMQDRSMHTSSGLSGQMPTPSYVHQPMRPPSKPEDKLFGDLVSLAKTKQNKPTV